MAFWGDRERRKDFDEFDQLAKLGEDVIIVGRELFGGVQAAGRGMVGLVQKGAKEMGNGLGLRGTKEYRKRLSTRMALDVLVKDQKEGKK